MNFYKLGGETDLPEYRYFIGYGLRVMYNKDWFTKEKYDLSVYKIEPLSQMAMYLLAKNNTGSIILSLSQKK